MKRALPILALLALSLPAFPQSEKISETPPQYGEQIDVNAVLLDVIVTDPKGNHILGLGPDDFIVKENGVQQTVDSVDYFTNRRLLSQREEQAPFKVERVREERYFIFFFDKPSDPGVLFDQLTEAREAVKKFLKTDMKETDLVAICDLNPQVLEHLSIASPDLTQKLRIASTDDGFRKGGDGRTQAQGADEAAPVAPIPATDL